MFKVLIEGCDPTRGTKHSACVDLYASEDVTIGAGETKLIGLGVCVNLDWNVIDYSFNHFVIQEQERVKDNFLKSHYLQLMLRSSLSKHLVIANGVGVIDLDYKDEIKIRLHNPIKSISNFRGIHHASGEFEDQIMFTDFIKINKGDKIAQITLLEHKSYLFGIESDVERDGGFGSTD